MPFVNVSQLIEPISAEQPSGPNLEYDVEFAKLDRAAQGKPEQQMGSTVVAAEDPDWKVLVRDSQALLGRTKDLRVVIHLAKALLRTGGVEGFSEALAVLRGLLEQYWDTVHPALDPDDDNDPTMRVNALAALTDSATLAALRVTPLVSSKALGKYNLRDIAVAAGELPPPAEGTAPTMATIDAAFDSIDLETLKTTAGAVQSARDNVLAIETFVTEKVGGSQAVNLSKLSAMLIAGHKHLAAAQGRRGEDTGMTTTDGEPVTSDDGAPRPHRGGGLPGQINTRDDVIKAIDMICAYYERHEPNSPVPILMKRSKRFATMTFLEIMKDVAPDAMSQAELLKGHSAGDEGSSS
jgi:type VI secretion system protein ImpA